MSKQRPPKLSDSQFYPWLKKKVDEEKQAAFYIGNGVDKLAYWEGTTTDGKEIPPATFIENTGQVQFTPAGEFKIKLKNGEIIDLDPETLDD